MHLLLGIFLTAAPAPQLPQATIVTKLEALKSIAAQAERLVRSGGFDLTDLNLTRELQLAAAQRR